MHMLCGVILSKPAPADHQVHPDLLTEKPIKSDKPFLRTVIGCERFGLNLVGCLNDSVVFVFTCINAIFVFIF